MRNELCILNNSIMKGGCYSTTALAINKFQVQALECFVISLSELIPFPHFTKNLNRKSLDDIILPNSGSGSGFPEVIGSL